MLNVINPFSREAENIIAGVAKNFPLIKDLPGEVFELAKKKIVLGGRREVLESYDAKWDIVSFYLLFRAAAKYGRSSSEARTVKDVTKIITEARIWSALSEYGADKSDYGYDVKFVCSLFSQFFEVTQIDDLKLAIPEDELKSASQNQREGRLKYAVEWKHLLPILRARKRSLTDFHIAKGYAFLSLSDLISLSKAKIEASIDEFLQRKNGKGDERLEELANLISKASSNPKYLSSYISKLRLPRKIRMRGVKDFRLKPEFFPPCIKHTLEGVTSGSRNYAITVLLTSFLSYARVSPIGSKKDAKISDYVKDVRVVTEELMPTIEEAAKRCSPPLFEDQPIERLNVGYHLGFGLTEEFRLEYSGKSSWYFTPNCEKVRRESPSLCTPDEGCKGIKNPLSYYTRKLFLGGKEREEKEIKESVVREAGELKFKGRITQIYDGSGLIQRCPKCDRWIIDNFCIVHSDVKGIYDLRIKARFEDGKGSYNLIFKREATEKAVNITLDEAKKLGDAVTLKKIKESLIGKNFEIEGIKLKGGNFLVKNIKEV
ncbi:MAG: hypothetical protein QME59_06325 [Candidatus Hydrothermarchaeota archaeon]|nr:hypothetical protein [Candidatus Hydrothermarchaeota archaeon]